jgi:hypothetical protein
LPASVAPKGQEKGNVDCGLGPRRDVEHHGLAVPMTASVRADIDGTRWQVAQLALAPLAPGDYIVLGKLSVHKEAEGHSEIRTQSLRQC